MLIAVMMAIHLTAKRNEAIGVDAQLWLSF